MATQPNTNTALDTAVSRAAAAAAAQQENPAILDEAFLCSVFNPTPRPRVIYDGLRNTKPIHIMPGKTVQCVLGDTQIGRLQEAENADPNEPNLKVTELGPAPKEQPKPTSRARRARPAVKPEGGAVV